MLTFTVDEHGEHHPYVVIVTINYSTLNPNIIPDSRCSEM